MQPGPRKIEVSIRDQELRLFRDGELEATFPVSTSRVGTGSEDGSLRTPLGQFRISERIGEGEALRTIFSSRQPQGRWNPADPVDADLVLTRILWLEGAERGNANTKERYIYIHGTNHEDTIGQPTSQGCVRMKNEDVLQLFGLVEEGTDVEIVE